MIHRSLFLPCTQTLMKPYWMKHLPNKSGIKGCLQILETINFWLLEIAQSAPRTVSNHYNWQVSYISYALVHAVLKKEQKKCCDCSTVCRKLFLFTVSPGVFVWILNLDLGTAPSHLSASHCNRAKGKERKILLPAPVISVNARSINENWVL